MKRLIFVFLVFVSCQSAKNDINNDFEIGIIADCQYCNCDINGNRFYRKAKGKLKIAIKTLNKKDLSYTVHLGDFIDRDYKSFDSVLPIWESLKSEKRHVLGNHDFSVADSLKKYVPNKMKIKNRYYSFKKYNWRFLVLDGNDLSFYGAEPEKLSQTDSLFNLLEPQGLPNLKKWNGGFSNAQLKWIKSELDQAIKQNENVGFYCHFPAVRDNGTHNIWNYKQFLELIKPYENVKFYFNGHDHNGDYLQKDGVHHLTFKSMLDTADSTAFSVARFTKDSIIVKGFGREESRRLKIK
jgi:hypothetical protein